MSAGERSDDDGDIDQLPAAPDELFVEEAAASKVLQAVDQLLRDAVAMEAPEIHLDPHPDGLMVRFRGPGRILHEPRVLSVPAPDAIARIKILARLDIAERRVPQDGVWTARIGSAIVRAMVVTLPTIKGERVMVRPRIERVEPPSLAEAGAPPPLIHAVDRALGLGRGLIVAAGHRRDRPEILGTLLRQADTSRKLVVVVSQAEPIVVDERVVVVRASSDTPGILRVVARHCPDVVALDGVVGGDDLVDAVALAREDAVVICAVPAGSPAEAISYMLANGVAACDLASVLALAITEDRFPRLCPVCRPPAGRPGTPGGCGACLDGRKGEVVVYRAVETSALLGERIARGHAGEDELRAEEARCTGSFLERIRTLLETGQVSPDDLPEYAS